MLDESVNNNQLYTNKREQRIVFLLVFMGVLSLTYGFFFMIDFLPEKPEQNNTESALTETSTINEIQMPEETETAKPIDPLPIAIIFDTLNGREVTILNPESDTVAELDSALLKGVVRHPDSADFKQKGTIFLLGHSSYLPNVMNKNFQAFNGIQKLAWGDTIRLRSADTEYVYRVDRVYEAKASDAEVKIYEGESRLTLATCDSFGTKDDRFVVEASLLESHALSL